MTPTRSVPPGLTAAVVAWVLGHRRASSLALLVVTLAAAWSATRIGVSFSSRDFFATSDEGAAAVAALDEMHARWGPDDATLLVLAQADRDVRGAASLAALSRIEATLAALPVVRRTLSIATVATASPTALHRAPVVPALVSDDGLATVIAVELVASSDDLGAVIPVVRTVDDAVAALDGIAGLHLTVAGVPATRAAFFTLAVHDQVTLGPILGAVVALVLWLAFRRPLAVLAPLLAAGLPLVWLLGTMAVAGEPVGLINQALFTLLPVIAVADGVHWIVRVDEESRGTPDDRHAAIVRAAAGVGKACALTSLTTAAGFVSLLVVDVAILRRFGGWAAVGVLYCWVAVLVIVPLVLSYAHGNGPVPRRSVAGPVARWSVAHPRVVAAFSLAILAGAGVHASTLRVDNRLGALLPAAHPVQRASTTVDRSLGGILTLQVQLSGDGVRPQTMVSLAQWADTQPEVRWVGDPQAAGVPFRIQGEYGHVSLHTADIGGQAFVALAQRVAARASTIPDVEVRVSGTSLVAYSGVNQVATRLRSSLAGLLVVVTVVIGIALRSLRLAMLAVPVNVLPLLLGGALLAAMGYTLDPLAAVIVAVALGIAVDDTLHLMARTAEARRAGLGPREAVIEAAEHSGRAILVSTLAIAAGFSVQLLASFPPLRLLGGLGAAIVVAAVVVDLTLLPAMLARMPDRGGRDA